MTTGTNRRDNGMPEPDTIRPARIFVRRTALQPEKRLVLAVLEEAVATAQASISCPRRASTEARAWIRSDDTTWPFSFVNVCATLDIDPGYLRGGLLQWVSRARDSDGTTPLPRWRARRVSGSRTCVRSFRRQRTRRSV